MGHHYVPRFLLREWLSIEGSDRQLLGHYWDAYRGHMRVRKRGENFFCNKADLFTVKGLPDGDDAIERLFFKKMDDAAAITYRKMLEGKRLSSSDRISFTSFVLSLEARRPATVDRIRSRATTFITESVNSDPEIRRMLDDAGIEKSAAEAWEEHEGFSIADQAMETVQKMALNARIGGAIAQAPWGTFRVQPGCDDFVLGDRPLIRINHFLSPLSLWVLPLSPKQAWFCSIHQDTFARVGLIPPRKFVAWINTASALSCDKYVFCQRPPTTGWLSRRLRERSVQMAAGHQPYGL